MTACGASLGPFLDSYHSAFGVLEYNQPFSLNLWGSMEYPALTTTWWVPELFGLAGFLIGWLYILLDDVLLLRYQQNQNPVAKEILSNKLNPSVVTILVGISFFTLQYWLSGILVQAEVDRTTILNLMSLLAALGFLRLDGTRSGFWVSAATALGGPLIEVGLLWASRTQEWFQAGGYHYNDLGETGFFPLWIVPVYFLGGPANGNLARGFWNLLTTKQEVDSEKPSVPCSNCNGTRQTPCPNCDGVGTYMAMGGREVTCTSCSGRGFVMCRECFNDYDEDPWDIEAIREKMRRMPDCDQFLMDMKAL